LSSWRKVRVSGADAVRWLHDLLTADVAGMSPGDGRRSLLLTPTGHIRADLQIARRADDLVLLQAPDQPEPVGLALSAYVLSADVSLEEATTALSLFALSGRSASHLPGVGGTSPSSIGQGVDVLTASGEPASVFDRECRGAGLVEAGPAALEAWRVL